MSFAVVEFNEVLKDGSKTVDIISSTWLDRENNGICYWPPNSVNITKAVKDHSKPTKKWLVCKIKRIMGYADSYKEARLKLKKAEYTSDLSDANDSSLPPPKKKKSGEQQQWPEEEVEDESEEDDEEELEEDEDSDEVPPTPPEIRSPAPPALVIQSSLGSSSPQLPNLGRSTPLNSPQLQRRGTQATHMETPVLSIYTKILTVMEEIKDTQRVHSQKLQTLLKKDKESQPEPPEGVEFPLKSQEDVQQLEDKLADANVMSAMVHMVAEIGGTSVDDATRRMMRFLFSNELALTYNLTGKHGKNKFKDLRLFKVMHEALKKNPLTTATNQQEAERALGKWFTGARDRGGLRAARSSK